MQIREQTSAPGDATTDATTAGPTTPMLRRYWLLGGAAVLALIGQQALDQLRGWRGGLLYLAAALLFGFGVRPAVRTGRQATPRSLRSWPREAQQALLAACLVTALLFVIVDTENLSGTVWILQAGAIALVVAAGRLADRSPRDELGLPQSAIDISTATTQLILAVIVIGGAWVRFHDLGSVPRGFWFDEADVALLARRIAEDGYRPVFAGTVPAYDAYLMAILSGLFGEGITTIRAVSAGFGIATILAGYLVGRELFGKMGGLIIAFLIAFSRWAITLSRVGMNNVTLPLFALLTLGFALRGHRRQSNLDFALAGMAAGAGMLFYSAIASSLLACAGFVGYLMLSSRQPRSRVSAQALMGIIGALVVVTPLAKFVVFNSDDYFSRNRNTAIWSDAGLLEDDNVWSALRKSLSRYLPMTSFAGDRNGRHNIPGDPMLPPLVSGLSLVALGAIAFRVDRWLTALVVLWLPLAFAPGVLSLPWEAPNSLRAVGVQPLAFVLAAAAVLAVARTVVTTDLSKHVLLGVLAFGLALTAWSDVSAYFDANQTRSDVWAVHSTPDTIAAELTKNATDTAFVQGVAFLRDSRQQQYLARDRPFDAVFGTEAQLPLYVPQGHDALFFALHDSYDIGAQAERMYPDATVQREYDGLASELVIVRVPADNIEASFGWTTDDDGVARTVLLIDQTGRYRFRMSDPSVSLVIDGQQFRPCDVNSDMPLAAGLHLVEVSGLTAPPILQWLEPESALPWTPVPADRLVQPSYAPGGLVARHFEGADDRPTPDLFELDTTLDLRMHEFVLPRPYQTEWTGGLVVPATGPYELSLRTDDELTLAIDGDTVMSNGTDFGEQSVVLDLDTGVHPIAVRYTDRDGRSEVVLKWRRADSTDEPGPIPAEQFVPWIDTHPLSDCTN